MPVHFEIDATLEKGSHGSQYTVLRNIPRFLRVGDTVRYRSNDGEVTVRFDQLDKSPAHSANHSPFVDSDQKEIRVVTSKDGRVKVGNKGKYFANCSIKITTPTGRMQEIRYDEDAPPACGNHVVKGPGG